jgi:hypothetical protein
LESGEIRAKAPPFSRDKKYHIERKGDFVEALLLVPEKSFSVHAETGNARFDCGVLFI